MIKNNTDFQYYIIFNRKKFSQYLLLIEKALSLHQLKQTDPWCNW